MPARSRLFLVVPKAADAAAIEVNPWAWSTAAARLDTYLFLSYASLVFNLSDLMCRQT